MWRTFLLLRILFFRQKAGKEALIFNSLIHQLCWPMLFNILQGCQLKIVPSSELELLPSPQGLLKPGFSGLFEHQEVVSETAPAWIGTGGGLACIEREEPNSCNSYPVPYTSLAVNQAFVRNSSGELCGGKESMPLITITNQKVLRSAGGVPKCWMCETLVLLTFKRDV